MTDHAGSGFTIDARKLEQMLLDENVPDEALRPYLMESMQDSNPFQPVVEVNPDRVEVGLTEAAVALSSLNGIARWRRHRRYRRKVRDWEGLRIVSEGDSWFQYPFLLTDVIDWLSEPYAVFSLDAAGDLIADMVRQGELITAVVSERPDVVLLSGGGNDLLGGANLARAVLPFEPGRPPEDYLSAGFDANLGAVLAGYTILFERLARIAPHTPVMCHVYDHAVPNQGRWLGQPLAMIGVVDPMLQRAIVRCIVDRFHVALGELAGRFPQVRLIDTRGSVLGRWNDELHPTDGGYAAVAQLFADAIADATGTAQVEIGGGAGIEASRLEPGLARYSDDALLAELGRRRRLCEAGDPGLDEPLLIFSSSLAGSYPELREAGTKAVAEARAGEGQDGVSPAEQRLLDTLLARSGRIGSGAASIGRAREAPSPAARRLLGRLATPAGAGGLEGGLEAAAAVEAAPDLDRRERLEEAERVLRRLAAGARDIDETVIDRLIRDAEKALLKLSDEGADAALTDGEVFGLEAVIETDGSRPVLFVQDGTIDLNAPDLQGTLAQRWLGAAETFQEGISRVASAVGAVQLPAFDNRRIGTAFAIAPGFVLTNRHVLEEIALFDGQGWRWKYEAEIDFAGEYRRDVQRRFKLLDVALWGPNPINRKINFANLDLAVLRVGDGAGDFPEPVSLEATTDRVRVGSAGQPPVYVMGFPVEPPRARGAPEDRPPDPGYEYEQVLERLFANRFGSKRWAPGLVEAGAGQLVADKKSWVLSHDASTLGGNSGSCVVEFHENGERVVGLHFGGRPRIENYAHVIAAIRPHLADITEIRWL